MKKTFKKLMAALLAVALLCAMAVPAFAAEDTATGSGTITIDKAINGETYTAYKIFDVVSSKVETDGSKTYVYTVAEGWAGFFEQSNVKDYVTVDKNGQPAWIESKKSDTDLQAFAKLALTYASTTNGITSKTATAAGNQAVINGLTAGYYVVSTNAGSLCILNTNGGNLKIDEKNEAPTIDKKIEGSKSTNDAAIGDVVNYTVTIHAKKGATGYVLTDTMTKGLTFNKDVKVTVGSNDLTLNNEYAVTAPADGATFKVTFAESYLNTIDSDTDIVVSYTATVNKDAEIGNTGNTNTAQLKYGNNSTVQSTTTTYSYEFDLVKTDSSNKLLTGAKFKLYDSATGTKPVELIKDAATGNYRVAEKNEDGAVKEIEIDSFKAVTISGLNKKTYYLEETLAPGGYNKLTERQPVELGKEGFVADATINNSGSEGATWTEGGVRVINNTGATLPSTGGMGTTLFYVLGGGLMVAAVVLLVTKKRMENK